VGLAHGISFAQGLVPASPKKNLLDLFNWNAFALLEIMENI
jgi:hypothetical protein